MFANCLFCCKANISVEQWVFAITFSKRRPHLTGSPVAHCGLTLPMCSLWGGAFNPKTIGAQEMQDYLISWALLSNCNNDLHDNELRPEQRVYCWSRLRPARIHTILRRYAETVARTRSVILLWIPTLS